MGKFLSLSNVLLMVSTVSILLAIGLAGGSLAKSVKCDFYNSGTTFGDDFYIIYAYQNLWTSYDEYSVTPAGHVQAYELIKKDYWRPLPRLLIQTSLGIGGVSLLVLVLISLIPVLERKTFVLNCGRIASSVLSISAGSILGYTLNYYKTHYELMLAPIYYDPNSGYPREDNLSTGFFMAATACALFFISASVNIVNVVILIKSVRAAVNPNGENQHQINDMKMNA